MPILNAIFDWFSVSVTQYFLNKYHFHNWSLVFLVFADVLSALVLVALLFAILLAAIVMMNNWGWEIHATQWLKDFVDDPWTPSSLWIFLMAITNLLPTLIHVFLALWGVLCGRLLSNYKDMSKWCKQVQDGNPLSPSEATDFANHLHVDTWRWAFVALSSLLFLVGIGMKSLFLLFQLGVECYLGV